MTHTALGTGSRRWSGWGALPFVALILGGAFILLAACGGDDAPDAGTSSDTLARVSLEMHFDPG